MPTATRRVGTTGRISFAGTLYGVGLWLSGETVEVSVDDGIVSISHRGVLVQTLAQRLQPDKELAALQRKPKPQVSRPRQPTVSLSVGDPQGRRLRVDQFRWDGVSGRQTACPASGHDPFRKHGAFANAGGRCSLT